jgi:hypothetical protein
VSEVDWWDAVACTQCAADDGTGIFSGLAVCLLFSFGFRVCEICQHEHCHKLCSLVSLVVIALLA